MCHAPIPLNLDTLMWNCRLLVTGNEIFLMVQVINFHEITFLHVIPYSLELSNMQTGRIIQNVSHYRAFKILIFVTNFVKYPSKIL